MVEQADKSSYGRTCLIIWGDQGAGKTLFADQLVTWRQVGRGDRIIVCNPRYHHDKETQLYASASEVLSTAQENRQRLPQLLAEALANPPVDWPENYPESFHSAGRILQLAYPVKPG